MKFGIINGSHRAQSQSDKVSAYIGDSALKGGHCESIWRYDLAGNPLPLWDEGVFGGDPAWEQRLQPLSAALHDCDAFVIVTPEWHGMVPAGLKNFFLMWAAGGELAHKPGLIVSVSASSGGAYPVAELRMSSYKNCRLCYIPEQLVVRNVNKVMNPESADNDARAHDYLHRRLLYCLAQLREYGKALATVRASGVTGLADYPNGM
jgi:NAD(P)H-dependent FMN reductase